MREIPTPGLYDRRNSSAISGLEGIQANGRRIPKLLLDNNAGRLGREKKEAAIAGRSHRRGN